VDEFEKRISTEIRKQEEVNQEQKRESDQRIKEFTKDRFTREVYGKNTVWVG